MAFKAEFGTSASDSGTLKLTGGASGSLVYNESTKLMTDTSTTVEKILESGRYGSDVTAIDGSNLSAKVAVSITGATGNVESITTGAGKDSIKVTSENVTHVDTGKGNDAVELAVSEEQTAPTNITLGEGNDTFKMTSGSASVVAGKGNDVIEYTGGTLTLNDAFVEGTDKIQIKNTNATTASFSTQNGGTLTLTQAVTTSEDKTDNIVNTATELTDTDYLEYTSDGKYDLTSGTKYYIKTDGTVYTREGTEGNYTYTPVTTTGYTFVLTADETETNKYTAAVTYTTTSDDINEAITLQNISGKLINVVDKNGNAIVNQTYGDDKWATGVYDATAKNTGKILTLKEEDKIAVVNGKGFSKGLHITAANIQSTTQLGSDSTGASILGGSGADTIEVTALSEQESAGTATVTSAKGKDVIVVHKGVNLVLDDFDFKNDTIKLDADITNQTYKAVADENGKDVTLYFGTSSDGADEGYGAEAAVKVTNGLWDGVKANSTNITIMGSSGSKPINATGISDPTKKIVTKAPSSKNVDLSSGSASDIGSDANGNTVKYNYDTDSKAGVETIDLSNVSNAAITLKGGVLDAFGTKKNDTIIGANSDLSTPLEGTVTMSEPDANNVITFSLTYKDGTDTSQTVAEAQTATVVTGENGEVTKLQYTKANSAEVNTDYDIYAQYTAQLATSTDRGTGATLASTIYSFNIGTDSYQVKQVYTVTTAREILDNGDLVTESGLLSYGIYKGTELVYGIGNQVDLTDETFEVDEDATISPDELASSDDNDYSDALNSFLTFKLGEAPAEGEDDTRTEYTFSVENGVTWNSIEDVVSGGTLPINGDGNTVEMSVNIIIDSSHAVGEAYEGVAASDANKYKIKDELVQIQNPTVTAAYKTYSNDAGSVDGSAGNDLFIGANGGNFSGGIGNDTIKTGAMFASLASGSSNSNVEVKATGGAGNETYLISGSNNLEITDYHNSTVKEVKAEYGQDQIIFDNAAYNQKDTAPLASRVRITNGTVDNTGKLTLTYSGKSFVPSTTYNKNKNNYDEDNLIASDNASGDFIQEVEGTVVIDKANEAGTLTVTHEGTKYTLAGDQTTVTAVTGVKNFLGALAPNVTSVGGSGKIDLSGITADSNVIAVTGSSGKDTLIGNGKSSLDGSTGNDVFIVQNGDIINGIEAGKDQVVFYDDFYPSEGANTGGIKIDSVQLTTAGAVVNGVQINGTAAITFANIYKTTTVKNGKVTEKAATDQMTRAFSTAAEDSVVSANSKDTYLKVFAGDVDKAVQIVDASKAGKLVDIDVEGANVTSVTGGKGSEYTKVIGRFTTSADENTGDVVTTYLDPTKVTTGKGNDTIAYNSANIVVTDFEAAKKSGTAYKSGDVIETNRLTEAQVKKLITDGSIDGDGNWALDFAGQNAYLTLGNGNQITLESVKQKEVAFSIVDSKGADAIFVSKLTDPKEYYETNTTKGKVVTESNLGGKARVDTTANTKGVDVQQAYDAIQILTGKGVDTITPGASGKSKLSTAKIKLTDLTTDGKLVDGFVATPRNNVVEGTLSDSSEDVTINSGAGADLIVIDDIAIKDATIATVEFDSVVASGSTEEEALTAWNAFQKANKVEGVAQSTSKFGDVEVKLPDTWTSTSVEEVEIPAATGGGDLTTVYQYSLEVSSVTTLTGTANANAEGVKYIIEDYGTDKLVFAGDVRIEKGEIIQQRTAVKADGTAASSATATDFDHYEYADGYKVEAKNGKTTYYADVDLTLSDGRVITLKKVATETVKKDEDNPEVYKVNVQYGTNAKTATTQSLVYGSDDVVIANADGNVVDLAGAGLSGNDAKLTAHVDSARSKAVTITGAEAGATVTADLNDNGTSKAAITYIGNTGAAAVSEAAQVNNYRNLKDATALADVTFQAAIEQRVEEVEDTDNPGTMETTYTVAEAAILTGIKFGTADDAEEYVIVLDDTQTDADGNTIYTINKVVTKETYDANKTARLEDLKNKTSNADTSAPLTAAEGITFGTGDLKVANDSDGQAYIQVTTKEAEPAEFEAVEGASGTVYGREGNSEAYTAITAENAGDYLNVSSNGTVYAKTNYEYNKEGTDANKANDTTIEFNEYFTATPASDAEYDYYTFSIGFTTANDVVTTSASIVAAEKYVEVEAVEAADSIDGATRFIGGTKNDVYEGAGSKDTIDFSNGGANTIKGAGRLTMSADNANDDAVAVVKLDHGKQGNDTFIIDADNQASISGYNFASKNQDQILFDHGFKADLVSEEIKTNGDLVLQFSDGTDKSQVTLAGYDGESIYIGQLSTAKNSKPDNIKYSKPTLIQQVSYDIQKVGSTNQIVGVTGNTGADKITVRKAIKEVTGGKGNDTIVVDFANNAITNDVITVTDFNTGNDVIDLGTSYKLSDLSGSYIYDGGKTATLVAGDDKYVVLEGVAAKDNAAKTKNVRVNGGTDTRTTKSGVVLQNNVHITATGNKGYDTIDLTDGMDFTESINAKSYKKDMTIKAGTNFSAFTASAYKDNLTLSTLEGSQQVSYTFNANKTVTDADTITFKLGTTNKGSQLAEIQAASGLKVKSYDATLGGNTVKINYETTAKKPKDAGVLALVDDAREGGNFRYKVQFSTEDTTNSAGASGYKIVTMEQQVKAEALGSDWVTFKTETSDVLNSAQADAWTTARQIKTGEEQSWGATAYYSYQVKVDVPEDTFDENAPTTQLTTALHVTGKDAEGTADQSIDLVDTNLNVIVKRENGKYSIDQIIYDTNTTETDEDGNEVKVYATINASDAAIDGDKATLFSGQGKDGKGLYFLNFHDYGSSAIKMDYSYNYNEDKTNTVTAETLADTTTPITREFTISTPALAANPETAIPVTDGSATTGLAQAVQINNIGYQAGSEHHAVQFTTGTPSVKQNGSDGNDVQTADGDNFNLGTWTFSTQASDVKTADVTLNQDDTGKTGAVENKSVTGDNVKLAQAVTSTTATSTSLFDPTTTEVDAPSDKQTAASVTPGTATSTGTEGNAKTSYTLTTDSNKKGTTILTINGHKYTISLDATDSESGGTGSGNVNKPKVTQIVVDGNNTPYIPADGGSVEDGWTFTMKAAEDGVEDTTVVAKAEDGTVTLTYTPKTKKDTVTVGGKTYDVIYKTDDFGNSTNEIATVGGETFTYTDGETKKTGTFTLAANNSATEEDCISADTTFTLNYTESTPAISWKVSSTTSVAKLFDTNDSPEFTITYGTDIFGNTKKSAIAKINDINVSSSSDKKLTVNANDATYGNAVKTEFTYAYNNGAETLTWTPTVKNGEIKITDNITLPIVYTKDAFGNSTATISTIGGKEYNSTDNTFTIGTDDTDISTNIAVSTVFTLTADEPKVEWDPKVNVGSLTFDSANSKGALDIAYDVDVFGNSTHVINKVGEVSNINQVKDDSGKTIAYTFSLATGDIGSEGATLTLNPASGANVFTIAAAASNDDIDDYNVTSGKVSWIPILNDTGAVTLVGGNADTVFKFQFGTDAFGNNTNKLETVTNTKDSTVTYTVDEQDKFKMTSNFLGSDSGGSWTAKEIDFQLGKQTGQSTGSYDKVTWTPVVITDAKVVLAADNEEVSSASTKDEYTITYKTDAYGNSINQIDSLTSTDGKNRTYTLDEEGKFTIVAGADDNEYGHDIVIAFSQNASTVGDDGTSTDGKERFSYTNYTRTGTITDFGEAKGLAVTFGTDIYHNSTYRITAIGSTYTGDDKFIVDGTSSLQSFTLTPSTGDNNLNNPFKDTTFTIEGFFGTNAEGNAVQSFDTDTALITWTPVVKTDDTVKLNQSEDAYAIPYETDLYGNSNNNIKTVDGKDVVVQQVNNESTRTLTIGVGTNGAVVATTFNIDGSTNAFTYTKSISTDDTVTLNTAADATGANNGVGLAITFGTDVYGNSNIASVTKVGEAVVTATGTNTFTFSNDLDSNKTGRVYTITLDTSNNGIAGNDNTVTYDAIVQRKKFTVTPGISGTNETGDTDKQDTYTVYYKADGYGNQLAGSEDSPTNLGIEKIEIVHGDGSDSEVITANALVPTDGNKVELTDASGYTITFDETAGAETFTFTVDSQLQTGSANNVAGTAGKSWYYDSNDTDKDYTVRESSYAEHGFAETTKLYDDFITADTSDLSAITTKTYNEAAITTDFTTDFNKRGIILTPLTSSLTTNKKKN